MGMMKTREHNLKLCYDVGIWNHLFLDQLVSSGQTIIEKLEEYTSQVNFGIVLATPDDVGYPKADEAAITTVNNINRYREQLEKIGFCFDWDRDVRTCEPGYYHWTQWAFQQMFNSFYCNTCLLYTSRCV